MENFEELMDALFGDEPVTNRVVAKIIDILQQQHQTNLAIAENQRLLLEVIREQKSIIDDLGQRLTALSRHVDQLHDQMY